MIEPQRLCWRKVKWPRPLREPFTIPPTYERFFWFLVRDIEEARDAPIHFHAADEPDGLEWLLEWGELTGVHVHI